MLETGNAGLRYILRSRAAGVLAASLLAMQQWSCRLHHHTAGWPNPLSTVIDCPPTSLPFHQPSLGSGWWDTCS